MDALTERDAWLILASAEGVGPETMGELLAAFGAASEVLAALQSASFDRWHERRRARVGRPLLGRGILQSLRGWPDLAPERLRQIEELGLWALTPLDEDFPAALRDLDPAPILLVGSGARDVLAGPRSIAVVGTRRPTAHGRWLTARICRRLVECGAVVVSGLAVGIDGAAHAATLDVAGRTVGIIGGGHRHPGPRAHAALRRDIVAGGGAIVSEYMPWVKPSKGTYPQRNRLIAAMAAATIVVEAPVRSGALITARHALELGRPVFVAPGRVGDWSTDGSLALLRETPARILAGIDELTEDLGLLGRPTPVAALNGSPAVTGDNAARERRSAALDLLTGAQRAVAELICSAPAGLDALVERTGLAPAAVSGAVTLLLMRGWIQPVGPAYLPAGPLLE